MVALVPGSRKRFRYTPKSDLVLLLDGCPFVVCEVVSDSNYEDRLRMLVQAGVLVRLMNSMKADKTKSFVVMAIYIQEGFSAERCLVYQPKLADISVCIALCQLSLTNVFRRSSTPVKLSTFRTLANP